MPSVALEYLNYKLTCHEGICEQACLGECNDTEEVAMSCIIHQHSKAESHEKGDVTTSSNPRDTIARPGDVCETWHRSWPIASESFGGSDGRMQ